MFQMLSFTHRAVEGDERDITKGLNSLKKVGFINYYGLQRFGTQGVATQVIGK